VVWASRGGGAAWDTALPSGGAQRARCHCARSWRSSKPLRSLLRRAGTPHLMPRPCAPLNATRRLARPDGSGGVRCERARTCAPCADSLLDASVLCALIRHAQACLPPPPPPPVAGFEPAPDERAPVVEGLARVVARMPSAQDAVNAALALVARPPIPCFPFVLHQSPTVQRAARSPHARVRSSLRARVPCSGLSLSRGKL